MTSEGKFDRYALMTTSKIAENRLKSDFWHVNQSQHFEMQLKFVENERETDLASAILQAYDHLNAIRLLTAADNYLGGRDPMKISNQIIVLFIDP